MKLSQQEKNILFFKFFALIFALCILLIVLSTFKKIKKEKRISSEEAIDDTLIKDSETQKSCFIENTKFYLVAFCLGAIWNANFIKKVGVL